MPKLKKNLTFNIREVERLSFLILVKLFYLNKSNIYYQCLWRRINDHFYTEV